MTQVIPRSGTAKIDMLRENMKNVDRRRCMIGKVKLKPKLFDFSDFMPAVASPALPPQPSIGSTFAWHVLHQPTVMDHPRNCQGFGTFTSAAH